MIEVGTDAGVAVVVGLREECSVNGVTIPENAATAVMMMIMIVKEVVAVAQMIVMVLAKEHPTHRTAK